MVLGIIYMTHLQINKIAGGANPDYSQGSIRDGRGYGSNQLEPALVYRASPAPMIIDPIVKYGRIGVWVKQLLSSCYIPLNPLVKRLIYGILRILYKPLSCSSGWVEVVGL